jgi:glycerophosphoryl diester phosphodiesterase
MENKKLFALAVLVLVLLIGLVTPPAFAKGKTPKGDGFGWDGDRGHSVQVGPRPDYLVEDMDESELKTELQKCSEGPFKRTDFSIGHRGAALQFPEHTKESYVAAARMGAGIVECDVTFTQDSELVCRHSQCDLHTTTNILAIPELAAKCTEPFKPAEFSPDTCERITPASATCCTSDITLAEFKSLCGKMDARDPNATTVEEYLGGTANWRTDLYSTCGTVLSHKESIELFKKLGAKMTPELKDVTGVTLPFGEFQTQADYAQKMIDEYKAADVSPKKVFAQSFSLDDVLYWIENEPEFGKQAVFLDGRPNESDDPVDPGNPTLQQIADMGVNIIAPPMWVLLTVENGEIVPSKYAEAAKTAGLDIITWTLERSGRIKEDVLTDPPGNTFYYQSTLDAISNDGDIMVTLDVLAQDVGILGIFSDWPATVTYYANCKGL